jgi:hypothetical protein
MSAIKEADRIRELRLCLAAVVAGQYEGELVLVVSRPELLLSGLLVPWLRNEDTLDRERGVRTCRGNPVLTTVIDFEFTQRPN